MYPYIAEFLGTAMFVFLGLSVNAGNGLEGSLFKNSGAVYAIIGWGLAFALPAMCFRSASGAYLNPAITLGLAVVGRIAWKVVPGYIFAEFLGAFFGACLMWLFYKDQFDATEDSETILSVFSTGPAIPNMGLNIFCEIIATMFLVIFFVNIPVNTLSVGVNYIYIWLGFMCVAYALGGTTGFAMNPARDIMARFAHTVLPISNKGRSNWGYAIVPFVGPFIGGILGALIGYWILSFPAL